MDLRIVICALVLVGLPLLAPAGERVRVLVGGEVRSVPLERYVDSAVASETYASWPREALKAQAVVARTYALHERERRRKERYDLESSVLSQRFGVTAPASSVREAVRETRGQYLSYGKQPILAVFHASAGGRTASAEEVWGQAVPYLRSVDSPDEEAPDHFWHYQIAGGDLIDALGEAGVQSPGYQLGEIGRTGSGRVAFVELGGTRLTGRDLRKILGGRAIRSALFEVREERGSVTFFGSGAGHGVGLSQWGARELARQRQSYRQILAHYYPGTQLLDASGMRSAKR